MPSGRQVYQSTVKTENIVNTTFRKLLAGLIIAGMLMACGCVSKRGVTVYEPGQDLIIKADDQFNQGLYNNAVGLYREYLEAFPRGGSALEALLKIGDAHFAQGKYVDARRQYRLLIERFPKSDFAEEARIGILRSWYNQKEYQKVFDYADTIIDAEVSHDCLSRKYAVVSDAYLALGEPIDAAYVLISGLRKVSGVAQKTILLKLSQVSGRIGPESLKELLSAIKDPGFRGYLSCQIADRYIQMEDYEQAVLLLSDFIAAYPENDYVDTASELLRRIDKASVYDRYAIGCLLPLTGRYRLFGERALKGIQFAFQEFLTTHPGNGAVPPIKLIIEDTGSQAGKAVAAARTLIDNKVAAIIGPLLPFKKAIQEADKHRIPIVAICQEQEIPGLGEFVFRNFLTPQMQVETLVNHACRDLGLRKFAVLYPDEAYGRVFAHKFWDEILKYDAEMVGFEAYNPSDTDFAEPIKKLAGLYYPVPEDLKPVREQRLINLGLKPIDTVYLDDILSRDLPLEGVDIPPLTDDVPTAEQITEEESEAATETDAEATDEAEEEKALVDFEALFVPDGPTNAGMIIPQLAFYDIVDTLLMGTNLWYSNELIKTAGGYVQGAVLPADFLETGDPQTAAGSFASRYELFYGEKPGFISAVAYDTAVILMNIINYPDVRFRHSIVDRLKHMDAFPGVTGRTAFGPDGEVRKKLTLLKIKSRNFVEIPEKTADPMMMWETYFPE